MGNFLVILELFGGVILIFVIGYFIGRLLKLDKYLKDKDKR